MGEVLDFPNVRSCWECCHYGINYCRLFDEQIDSEVYAAKDCAGYEPE